MIPKNVLYMNKIESAPARQYTSSIPANNNGDYLPGTKCTINIPTQPNTVLVASESYLKFTVAGITNGAAANGSIRLDKCGVHGCIQRIKVTNGSNEIQDLDNYGNLVGLMMTLQQSGDGFSGKQSIMSGTCPGSVALGSGEVINTTVGDRLSAYGVDVAAAAVVPPRTFGINLMSYVGSLCGDKYIPLFEMTGAPLTLELTFVSSALQFLCCTAALAAGNNFIVRDVEFMGTFIELSDDTIFKIKASQGGQPLQYVIQNYSNVQYNSLLLAGGSSVSIPVSAKYASLKSLFMTMRQFHGGSAQRFPYATTHFNLSQWRLRIGSQLLPSKAPNSIPEYYCELLKAIGSLSDVDHEPSINKYNYNMQVTVANNEGNANIAPVSISGCFALGFDCESYANANKDTIFAGMNTLNSDIYWNADFGTNAANIDVRFDIYALYDQVMIFENGNVRTVK